MSECDHIIGLSDGNDESWLTRQSNEVTDAMWLSFGMRFNFCPDCGERLLTPVSSEGE